MRHALLLASGLLMSGCTGPAYWPYPGYGGRDPYLPPAQTEVFDRVRNQGPATLPPIGVEAGILWPPAGPAVPTLLDMQKQAANGVRVVVPEGTLSVRRRDAQLCKSPAGLRLGIC
jgi:hypothetical protein